MTSREQILSVLATAASPMITHDVARAVRSEPKPVYAMLLRLRSEGLVQRRGAGRKAVPGQKQVEWRLAPPSKGEP
jgi:DNA-binding IclR family transcriptional regulator